MELGDSVRDSLREILKKSVLVSYTPISNSLWHSVWNSLIDPALDSLYEIVLDANGKSYVEDLVSTFVWDLVVDSVGSVHDSVLMSVEYMDDEID